MTTPSLNLPITSPELYRLHESIQRVRQAAEILYGDNSDMATALLTVESHLLDAAGALAELEDETGTEVVPYKQSKKRVKGAAGE